MLPDGEHVWAGGTNLYTNLPANRSCSSDEAARAIALFSMAQMHREELERKERSYRSIYIPIVPGAPVQRAPYVGPHLVHCDNWGNGDAMCEDM